MSAVEPVTPPPEPTPAPGTEGQSSTVSPQVAAAASIDWSSPASIQKNAPEVWRALLISFGMQSIQQMQDSEARRKKAQREMQN